MKRKTLATKPTDVNMSRITYTVNSVESKLEQKNNVEGEEIENDWKTNEIN